MLILSVLNIILLFFLLNIERKITRKDIFSAGSFFIYFAFLPALSNLYFSFNQKSFEAIVFGLVASQYRDMFFVHLALMMQILGNIIVYMGIQSGYRSKEKFSLFILRRVFLYNLLEDKNNNTYKNKIIFIFGLIVLVLGILVYLKFVSMMGGLSNIWNNLHARSVMNAGLGYYQTFYGVAIQFGSFFMFYIFYKRKNFLYAILLLIVVNTILGSMGSRGPTIHFLMTMLIFYHYKFNRVKSLMNYKLMAMYILFPIFILVVLQFRSNSPTELNNIDTIIEKSIDSLESGFIARVGRLERDVVILKYFSENDFWWGKSYLGLLSAPIPRTIYPDKPPIDTGMYLRTIAKGIKVDPPQPVRYLANSSWPEHNWIGYMNWGLPGFILLFFLSGYILGRLYMYMKRLDFPLLGTFLYAYLIIGGQFLLAPSSIVNTLMLILILNLLAILVFSPIKRIMSNNRYRRGI